MHPSREVLSEFIKDIKLIDTHEHIEREHEINAQEKDIFGFFSHYAGSDLASAGMPWSSWNALFDENVEFSHRADIVLQYWPWIQHTGYGKAVSLILKDLFAVEELSRDTIKGASQKVAASNHHGWYKNVLKTHAGIETALVDIGTTEVDRALFQPVMRYDQFVLLYRSQDFVRLGERYKRELRTLDDLCETLGAAVAQGKENGSVAVKVGLAYDRTLDFGVPSEFDAQVSLEKILASGETDPGFAEVKPLQDYMMNQLIQRAIDYDLPIQIHTGFQEPSVTRNGNHIEWTDPLLLNRLLLKYPEATFVLFHGGMPFSEKWLIMGKSHQNVRLDMCWAHIISPRWSEDLFRKSIELVPYNKIMAFGGDYLFVEGAYAHAKMARQVVAKALGDMVADGYITLRDAKTVAEAVFRTNAIILYDLES